MIMSHTETMELCEWGPENISKNGKRAIEELIRGRRLTTQLQAIIRQPSAVADSWSSESDLVLKILESLNEAISILKTSTERDQLAAAKSTHDDAPKSEDSSESCKTSSAFKARRGCCKRSRRTSETLRRETPNLIEDGHSWRKYGQKFILNAKHPRNYFRCTHKYDQGCQATKQVQKVEDDPPRFVTTYYGRHTCRNLLKAAPQIILDSPEIDADKDSSILLSFAAASNTNPIIIGNNQSSSSSKTCDNIGACTSFPPASSSSSLSVKEEIKQEIQSLHQYRPALFPSHDDDDDDDDECNYLTNFKAYSSCTPSPRSCSEMDMMRMPPVLLDFDDVLQFEF